MARAILTDRNYEFLVLKNPKVGHKPPHFGLILTNCWFGDAVQEWVVPSGCLLLQTLPPVNGAHQMALQLRIMSRQMTWSATVHVFMVRWMPMPLRHARQGPRGRRHHHAGIPIGDHQAAVFLRPKGCALTASPQVVHAPVKVVGKQLCSHCRLTSTVYNCQACGVHLHIKVLWDGACRVGRGQQEQGDGGGDGFKETLMEAKPLPSHPMGPVRTLLGSPCGLDTQL